MSETDGKQEPAQARGEAGASFMELMNRLQAGDDEAAREIHRRYTPGLVALAARQLSTAFRGRVDPASVVQSVYASFFQRYQGGQFLGLREWNDLWGLLTVITLRKCLNRRRYHRQACRDVGREVDPGQGGSGPGALGEVADPEPTPLEAAILTETLEQLVGGLEQRGQRILELLLQGHTPEEVRREVGCGERTVRRVRDRVKQKLQQMQSEE